MKCLWVMSPDVLDSQYCDSDDNREVVAGGDSLDREVFVLSSFVNV